MAGITAAGHFEKKTARNCGSGRFTIRRGETARLQEACAETEAEEPLKARPALCRGLVAGLVAGATLAACNDGSSDPELRLHFQVSGNTRCHEVDLQVDLQVAGAVVRHLDDGTVDCEVATGLRDAGCEVRLSDNHDGTVLFAAITDCSVEPGQTMFHCGFEQADAALLQANSVVYCECVRPGGCDSAPPLCITQDPLTQPCEICGNTRDDDGDSLVDCEDPHCSYLPECLYPTTTTLSCETSMPDRRCTVRFRLADDVTAGSLQWTTDYNDAPGAFTGEGEDVECISLFEDSIALFEDDDSGKSLDSGLISLGGIVGPVEVSACTFLADAAPSPEQFSITVLEASTPDLRSILPLPEVTVGGIDCDDSPCTSTTSNTVTHSTWVEHTLPPPPHVVVFRLQTASAPLVALQFEVDYGGADGEFEGRGDDVSCQANSELSALFAANDDDAERTLTFAHAGLDGFRAPIDLVTCTFLGGSVEPGDFSITIEDAVDENGDPVSLSIAVLVTEGL